MFIRNRLTEARDLVILKKNDSIGHALELLKKHNLKSVPVTDENGRFAGILSKEGLFELLEKGIYTHLEELKNQKVADAISFVKPLSMDNNFEDTLSIIVRYPFVPIINEEQNLLGIVKRKGITSALETSFGVGVPGIRLLIGTQEMEGRLEKILEIVHQMTLNVVTAVAFDAGDQFNRRVLLKVEHTDKKEELVESLENTGFKVLSVQAD